MVSAALLHMHARMKFPKLFFTLVSFKKALKNHSDPRKYHISVKTHRYGVLIFFAFRIHFFLNFENRTEAISFQLH